MYSYFGRRAVFGVTAVVAVSSLACAGPVSQEPAAPPLALTDACEAALSETSAASSKFSGTGVCILASSEMEIPAEFAERADALREACSLPGERWQLLEGAIRGTVEISVPAAFIAYLQPMMQNPILQESDAELAAEEKLAAAGIQPSGRSEFDSALLSAVQASSFAVIQCGYDPGELVQQASEQLGGEQN